MPSGTIIRGLNQPAPVQLEWWRVALSQHPQRLLELLRRGDFDVKQRKTGCNYLNYSRFPQNSESYRFLANFKFPAYSSPSHQLDFEFPIKSCSPSLPSSL